ncbi:kynureninase [Bhargavaea beijingensis]|nr:kynureninase [Bhargavaea beijingensis]
MEEERDLDRLDSLKRFREEFYIQPEMIYMDGNSLGLMSRRAERTLLEIMDSWKAHGINGWTGGECPWFYLPEQLSAKMAPFVGAKPEEVMVTGSTTSNLHQILATFFRPDGKRTKILADELNFPSDIYAIKSQLELRGLDPVEHLVSVNSRDGHLIEEEDIIGAMSEEIAMAILPSVLYRSGQVLDMPALTEAAHRHGILIGYDLCHSVGAMEHSLHDWGADFAFWCTYKFLNGGPGSTGGLFIHERHFGTAPGLAGWFGSDKEKQFDMEHTMTPAPHAGAYQVGTPNIFSMAPLAGSLELFEEAGLSALREKSLRLTRFMMELVDQELDGHGFKMANPREDGRRGGHVYLEHEEAARICSALKAEGVIPDFRAPKGIRLAPVALYNSFEEVCQTILTLKKIMDEKAYMKFENQRGVVA